MFSYVETNLGGITGTLKMTKSWSMHDIGSYLEGGHLKWWPFWIFTWLTLFSQIMNQSESMQSLVFVSLFDQSCHNQPHHIHIEVKQQI